MTEKKNLQFSRVEFKLHELTHLTKINIKRSIKTPQLAFPINIHPTW